MNEKPQSRYYWIALGLLCIAVLAFFYKDYCELQLAAFPASPSVSRKTDGGFDHGWSEREWASLFWTITSMRMVGIGSLALAILAFGIAIRRREKIPWLAMDEKRQSRFYWIALGLLCIAVLVSFYKEYCDTDLALKLPAGDLASFAAGSYKPPEKEDSTGEDERAWACEVWTVKFLQFVRIASALLAILATGIAIWRREKPPWMAIGVSIIVLVSLYVALRV